MNYTLHFPFGKKSKKEPGHKILILILSVLQGFSLSFLSGAKAQGVLGGEFGKGIDINTQSNGVVTQIPMAPAGLEGNSYLFDQWLPSSLDFGSLGKADGLYIRYDLMNSLFEVRLQNQVRLVNNGYVHAFSVTDTTGIVHQFMNCSSFAFPGAPVVGFFEILSDGKYRLLLYTKAVIIKSNYVMALDMGYKNDKISKQENFFIARENEAFKVPPARKNLILLFPEKKGLGEYLKQNKINIHKVTGLKKLAGYLNE